MPNDMVIPPQPPHAAPGNAAIPLERVLVVSTAHVPHAALEFLEERPGVYPRRVLNDEYGVVLSVPDEGEWQATTDRLMDASTVGRIGSHALIRVMALAAMAGASWLSLDRDGQTIPGLRVFDW
jgi:hypothetical protein